MDRSLGACQDRRPGWLRRTSGAIATVMLFSLVACAPGKSSDSRPAAESSLGACQDRHPGEIQGVEVIFNRAEIRRLRLLSGTLPKDAQPVTATPVTFQVVPAESPDAEPTPEVVQLPAGNVAGISWAWSQGAAVYAGIEARGLHGVSYVLVDPKDSSPFFVGSCAFDELTQPLRQQFGEDYEKSVLALALTGAEAASAATATVGPPVLNAGVTDPKVLAELRSASIRYIVPDGWLGTPFSIGTVIDAGINDTIDLDGSFASPGLPEISTYLPKTDGAVQIWLRTQGTKPRQALIGTVRASDWGPDTDDDVLNVSISTAQTPQETLANPKVSLRVARPS